MLRDPTAAAGSPDLGEAEDDLVAGLFRQLGRLYSSIDHKRRIRISLIHLFILKAAADDIF